AGDIPGPPYRDLKSSGNTLALNRIWEGYDPASAELPPGQQAYNSLIREGSPRVPGETIWCGRKDSNFHGLSATATSTLRVYQFRHDRIFGRRGGIANPAASFKAVAVLILRHGFGDGNRNLFTRND